MHTSVQSPVYLLQKRALRRVLYSACQSLFSRRISGLTNKMSTLRDQVVKLKLGIVFAKSTIPLGRNNTYIVRPPLQGYTE